MRPAARRLLVLAGLLAAPATTNLAQRHATEPVDPRLVRLRHFLDQYDCPIGQYAEEFLDAADRNDLDWRLLPSISFVESSGGKAYRNNNVFGWDSCRERFRSVTAGIRYVAGQLGNSELYREKTTAQKLRIYNPRVDYTQRLESVMRSISATQYPLTVAD